MKIQIANQQKLAPVDRRTLRALCRKALADHGADADLSVVLVDNAAIRQLNARYRQEDEVTDVLSFPLGGGPGPEGDRLLGEVVVSVEKALDEARRRGLAPEAEIALYVAHGLLHLLGYDDHEPADTRRMRQAERRALEEAGLHVPPVP